MPSDLSALSKGELITLIYKLAGTGGRFQNLKMGSEYQISPVSLPKIC